MASGLTKQQQAIADTMRAQEWGDRKIAKALDVPYGKVRWDRENRLADFDPSVAADPNARVDGYRQVVVIPDTQWPWQDEQAEACLLEYIKVNQPEELLHIGDAADFYSLASFRKKMPPSERMYFKQEVEVVRQKFRQYANCAPEARKRLVLGNHDERLPRYLEEQGGELFDLFGDDDLSYESITRSAEAGWETVGDSYGDGCWVGEPGGLWATHGDLARKWSGHSAKAMVMEKYGHSIIHGHTHRLGKFYHTRQNAFGHETVVGIEVGSLASMDKTPRATKVVDWQYGFGIVWVSTESARFHVDLACITDGGTVIGGRKYGV